MPSISSLLTSLKKSVPSWVWALLLFLLVPALTYLPLVSHFGLVADDWYLAYIGKTQGLERFWDVFIVDRPLRAPLVAGFFALFGASAPLYSYSAYVFRVLGGLGLLWALHLLWPKQKTAVLAAALLFVIYPGFLDSINAIDYQSHLVSLCLALWSIALSIKAVMLESRARAAGLWLLSLLLTLVYLGLMEYYIGLEAFRFLAVGLLLIRRGGGLWQKMRRVALAWVPLSVGPGLFLVWRLFFFDNQRGTTDISSMAASFSGSPLMRGLWSLVYLFQDLLNTVLFAWVIPVYQLAFRLRLRDFLLGFALALLAAGLTLAFMALSQHEDPEEPQPEGRWQREVIWLGLASCALALAPIMFGSRHIVFPIFSRFTLTASVGGILALVGFCAALPSKKYRAFLLALAVLLAVLTHYANAVKAAEESAAYRSFWWQMAWRAPGIQAGTTLTARIAGAGLMEDYYIWAPANLIYHPEKKTETPIPVSVSAFVINSYTAMNVLGGAGEQGDSGRGLLTNKDYGNILILSQPTENSCLQVLDGKTLELSSAEQYDLMAIAPYSKIENLIVDGDSPTPPREIFGPEPAHSWCYYYEKAALARQRGDWQEVARLGDEAVAQDLRPGDRVEWMPFLQAYARLGREDKVRALAPILMEDRFLAQQVRKQIALPEGAFAPADAGMKAALKGLFGIP